VSVKVSIIVPVYNGERCIERCLDSILAQTIDSYEIICIDDGSSDNSALILDRYALKYPTILHVRHTCNQGASKAREVGMRIATGDFIGFVDCDDMVLPEMFDVLYNVAIEYNADISVCGYKRIKSNRDINIEMCDWENQVLDVSKDMGCLAVINTSLWNKLYRREIALNPLCFDNPPRVGEDMMFLLSIYPRCSRIAFVNAPLYLYYVEAGNAMTYFDSDEMEVLCRDMELTRAHIMEVIEDNEIQWNYLWSLFVLIHLGFSVILRAETSGKKKCIKMVYEMLNKYVPDWKQNPFLQLDDIKFSRVKIVHNVYKRRMIYVIMMFSNLIIKMIKW